MKSQVSEAKSERIVARATPSLKALIGQAAALRGLSVTDFVLSVVQREAETTVRDQAMIQCSTSAQIQLANALINPPEPNKALRDAFEDYTTQAILSRS